MLHYRYYKNFPGYHKKSVAPKMKPLVTLEPPDLGGRAVALLVPGCDPEDDGGLRGGVDVSGHETERHQEMVESEASF